MSSSTQSNASLINRMFAVGAHFGFKKSRRHPTVARFLFGTKDGNDIFDLEKTAPMLEAASAILEAAGAAGKTVLFVGTKDEVARLVEKSAVRAGAPHVTNRWIGGMLTNFAEIKKRITRLENLEHEQAAGELDRKYTKKERVVLQREMDKLRFNFAGIAKLQKRPDYLLVVDPRHDAIAVAEANELRVPIIAIASSDCDLSVAEYPVVVNDALQASVTLALDELTAALMRGMSAQVATPVAATPARRTRSQA
jgi:small subunit ribosomal protein S2